MNGKWTLTVRDGPRVGHKRFETPGEAITRGSSAT